MPENVELASLDLRYEGHRMKSPAQEGKLLASIQQRGVETPLEGVTVGEDRVLLNGFKRYRCAKKLGVAVVPYVSLGEDEASGIIAVLRTSNEKRLGVLEQARFIDDLIQEHRMTPAEVAETLARSKSWVVMRIGLIREMGAAVREQILCGAFPVYSYLYTLRPLMRMNAVAKKDIEAFVAAVSGRKLAVREVHQLAHGYLRGPEWFRNEVDAGNLDLALQRLKETPAAPDHCDGFEGVVLKDIQIVSKYMRLLIHKAQDPRLSAPTRTFRAQASLLLAGTLSRMTAFRRTVSDLHDRFGQT